MYIKWKRTPFELEPDATIPECNRWCGEYVCIDLSAHGFIGPYREMNPDKEFTFYLTDGGIQPESPRKFVHELRKGKKLTDNTWLIGDDNRMQRSVICLYDITLDELVQDLLNVYKQAKSRGVAFQWV